MYPIPQFTLLTSHAALQSAFALITKAKYKAQPALGSNTDSSTAFRKERESFLEMNDSPEIPSILLWQTAKVRETISYSASKKETETELKK